MDSSAIFILYFDCGFSSSTPGGHGGCSPLRMHSSYRNLTYESSSGDDCFQEDERVGDECSIGITLKQSKGKFIIASIDEDGGGEKSGAIHVNDIILQIEGRYFLKIL
jgi:C-terminal processing protease CtpA/Prc